MRRAGWVLAVLATSSLAALAPSLRADEPAGSAGPVPGPAPSSRRDQRLERRLQQLQQRAAELASALPLASVLPPPSALPSGLSSASPPGLALSQELARRWAEHSASRLARREQRRAALTQELGQLAANPDIRAELQLHARRVSDLARAEFVAQNARSGKQRDEALARIAKLKEREAARHRQKLARLVSAAQNATPAPSAIPAPSASGGPSR